MLRKKFVKINEIEFDIRVSGRGRPFIWGHGLTSSMDGEDALDIFKWNTFSDHIQLIRYDARGHGGTESSYTPDHYHWRSLADDMTAIADALHADTYIAGGQSMGCATAIYAVVKALHRVEGLILVTPPTAWEMRKGKSASYRKMAKINALLGGKLLAKLANRRLTNDLPDWLAGAPEEKIESTTEGLKAMDRKTLSVLYKGAALADLPAKDVIRSMDIPALILAWTGDPGHPLEIAVELNQLLPQSSFVVAKDYSDVEKWPRLMQDFILNINS
jgi:pimeloyl-ACP methyl ester carboxylesterase